jgi:general secretion pathway protein A
VRRAYREIEAVPLRRTVPTRRVGWVAAVLLLGIGLAAGVPRLGLRLRASAPSVLPAVAEPEAPAPEPEPESPAPPLPTTPAARTTGWDLERRLAAADPLASARVAADAVLGAWRAAPLADGELQAAGDVPRAAWRRGFETLPLTGNLSMLRLLDLPAILELRIPGASGPRFAALVGVDDLGATLVLDGARVAIEPMALDRIWLGQAQVVWRDFESLGPTLGASDRGPGVGRLKELLARSGAYAGAPGDQFDAATAQAVVEFQRSRLLVPDGRVGRLTRIVLYAAAGGYPRPTLAGENGGAS